VCCFLPLLCPRPLLLSVRLSARPSVAYIANNSRTQRPSVPKFGMKVAHLRCDSQTSFKVKRSKVRVRGVRGHSVSAEPGGDTACYTVSLLHIHSLAMAYLWLSLGRLDVQRRRQELMERVLLLSFPHLSVPSPLFLFPFPPLSFPSRPLSFPLSPLPYPFPSFPLLSPPLRTGAPLNQLGGLGSAVSSPSGVRGPKTNVVHSRAVRKPLVAISLSIRWSEKLD